MGNEYEKGTLDERGPYDIIDKEGKAVDEMKKSMIPRREHRAYTVHHIHQRLNLAALEVLVYVNKLLEY